MIAAPKNKGGIKLWGSKMKTSDFFDSNVTTQIDESETRGVGACALCDPEFAVETTHRSITQVVFNTLMFPKYILQVGPFVAKGLMFGVEWIHYKFWYVEFENVFL